MPSSESNRLDSGGSNGGNINAGVYSQGQGQESSPSLGEAINGCQVQIGESSKWMRLVFSFLPELTWEAVTAVWPYTVPCTFQPEHWSKLARDTGCVEMGGGALCVLSRQRLFYSWIEFGQCTGIGFLPSPLCPGQLAQGSRAWQIRFGLGTYQQCPPSLEILSFTWTAVERVELFVQSMRRTAKKEEVKKCSFEHTSRAIRWGGVAGMTEMIRVAGLSHCAAKKHWARALASPWNCTGEESPGSLLPSSVGCLCKNGEVSPSEAHHYPILSRPKLPHVPSGRGEVSALIPPSTAEGTLCTITACTQRLTAFTNCQVDGAKIGFALWCQAPAQRMCIYFSKLRKLTQQIVPAWEEKVKHCDLISTKKLVRHAEK